MCRKLKAEAVFDVKDLQLNLQTSDFPWSDIDSTGLQVPAPPKALSLLLSCQVGGGGGMGGVVGGPVLS